LEKNLFKLFIRQRINIQNIWRIQKKLNMKEQIIQFIIGQKNEQIVLKRTSTNG
jgi:hypothetical protein